MNYLKTAREILALAGGKENIVHLTHCSTRLRLTLADNNKPDYNALGKVEGVIGIRNTAQCQIIIGNEVVEVYEALKTLVGDVNISQNNKVENQKWAARVIDFVISIFQPLIPAIAGGGVLKSILLLLITLGWLEKGSNTHVIFDSIGSAPLYFLPILVAITTANKLNVNPLVAVSAVGALLIPSMTKVLADGAIIFQLDLHNIPYAYQVFPAILCVLFYAQIETRITQYSPKPIRVFFVPLVGLALTVPVTLIILGPLGYTVGTGMSAIILAVFGKIGFVATALLAAILPFMIATGMHKAMIPYAVSSMTQLGKEILYLPASLAHNIAESGASFAVAFKTQDAALRATAISAGISALCGITEPAIYGVTLIHKPVLYSVMFGGAIGGAFIGITAVEAFALVGPGLPSITLFTSPTDSMNLIYAFIAIPISFFAAFLSVLVLWKEEVKSEVEHQDKKTPLIKFNLCSPVTGTVIPLAQVDDDVFSSKLIGDGIAVIPDDNILYAPVAGKIVSVYETGHALTMLAENGAEIIFHIGIDTVKLGGKYFAPQIAIGANVAQGDPLVIFDRDAIRAAGYDPVVIVIIANDQQYSVVTTNVSDNVTKCDPVLLVEKLA
jgi:beta-glucoside PTS system EIICBA component